MNKWRLKHDIPGQSGRHHGGAQGIGKCIAECFAADVITKSGKVDVLVNNALPLFKGINECTYEEFAYAQAVGVVAPFYLAKLFKDSFAEAMVGGWRDECAASSIKGL